jgi:hypothetical protein
MTNRLTKTFTRCVILAGVAAGLVGCASIGQTDNPIVRNFTWDRYVGGDDIARACAPGQPARLRLVYNAIENQQRRAYDFTAQPDGGAMLEAQVISPPVLNDSRRGISVNDPMRPWRGDSALYRLTPEEFAKVRTALDRAGFERPAPEGLHLRGDSFFWAASSCRDGRFHFNAWGYPSPEFDRMAEPLLDAVLPYDRTGIAAQRPYPVPLPPYNSFFNTTDPDVIQSAPQRFIVGRNGLRYSQGTIN